MQRSIRWTALVIVAISAGNAAAEPGAVAPPGRLDLTGAVDINLSSDDVLDPVVLGFDVYYGIGPKLDAGLVHTSVERTGFLADRDGGLCLGEDRCPDIYDRPGALARYQLSDGDLAAIAEAGLLVVSISDPTALSLKLGIRARWQSGALFVATAPNLFVGLTGRTIEDAGVELAFNEERLHLPVDVGYAVTDQIAPFVQIGIAGPVADFLDAFNTPVGLGVQAQIDERLAITAWFSFLNLVNREPELELATDLRSGGVSATYRY